MPNNDDQLQQQYQDILNKYASSITPPTPIETLAEKPVDTPVDTPKVEVQKPESLVLTDSSKISPPQIIEKPIVSEPIIKEEPTVPPIYFPPKPTVDKPSNLFKYLFYFSLLLFIGVVFAVVYSFTSN